MTVAIQREQLSQLSNALSQALNKIDDNILSQALAETLPLVGNNLRDAAASSAQLHDASTLGSSIRSGIDNLLSSGRASFTETEVEAALNAALATQGLSSDGVDARFTSASELELAIHSQRSGDSLSVPLESDLGLPNLGLKTSGNAQVALASSFHFKAGLDSTGFYLSTGPDQSFSLRAAASLSGLSSNVMLGGLGFVAQTNPAGSPVFDGTFKLTLKDNDGKLRLDELNGDLLDANLSGHCDLDLALSSAWPANTMLPQLQTNLNLGWDFSDSIVNPTDNNEDFGLPPVVYFNDSKLDINTLFNGLGVGALTEIARVTQPLEPVISILTTPIPLLSDLGSRRTTLLEFAGLSQDQTAAIKGLADLIDILDYFRTVGPGSSGIIDLGSLKVDADLRTDKPQDALLSRVRNAISPVQQNELIANLLRQIGSVGGGGLAFPILEDPSRIGDILLGNNSSIFEYQSGFDSGNLAPLSLFFPVLGPVGVRLAGKLAASAMFNFGFDSQGAREYFASGMQDASTILDGFYVRAADDSGSVLTGLAIDAGVEADLAVNLGIAEAGVGGDITANVIFGMDDGLQDSDGKIRGNKLKNTPVTDLFTASGMLTCGLHAYLEIGISPFSAEFSFDSPRVVLINFDGEKNTPILAEATSADTLSLNIGDRSAKRIVGNLEDIAEKISIREDLTPGFYLVEGFKTFNLLRAANLIQGNGGLRSDEIILSATLPSAALLSGGDGRDLLTTGMGKDTLHGDAGPDVLNSGGETDQLYGDLGNDRLIGGAGPDVVDGGAGLDTASFETAAAGMRIDLRTMLFTGDGTGDQFISIEQYEGTNFNDTIIGNNAANRLLGGLDGDDLILGLDGEDYLTGGKGSDDLQAGRGNDLLSGGEGADRQDGGPGVDTASYLSSRTPVNVSLRTGQGRNGDAQGDILISIEALFGSPMPFGDPSARRNPFTGEWNTAGTGDNLEGDAGPNTISGFGGADDILGGDGNDVLYGDSKDASSASEIQAIFDADTIKAGNGDDNVFGQQGNDDLDGEAGRDTVLGGDGDDHLHSMDLGSADLLDGGMGTNRLSADYSDKQVSINWIGGQNNDYTFSDGDIERNFQNIGELITANQPDRIVLDNASDDGYDNVIRTNGGNDFVRSGMGSDRLDGGAGQDTLHGGASADWINGGSGNDILNPGTNPVELQIDVFNGVVGYRYSGDTLIGGDGVDTARFDELRQSVTSAFANETRGKQYGFGVTIDLATNTTGRAATGIVISGIENIVGTNYLDNLYGDDKDNTFEPLRGGGFAAPAVGAPYDLIDGRGGVDTVKIDFSQSDDPRIGGVKYYGVNGELIRNTLNSDGSESDVWADGYSFMNIERVDIIGTRKPDFIHGNLARFILSPDDPNASNPALGADVLDGRDGNDTLNGFDGSDTLLGGNGNDLLIGQEESSYPASGRDRIDGGAGDDIILNASMSATGTGFPGSRFQMDGGTGFDILSADFSNQAKPIIWSSANPTDMMLANGNFAKGFEQLHLFHGGSGHDQITQLGRVNTKLYGEAGNDVLNSGLGIDLVFGGEGTDVAVLDFSALDSPNLGGVISRMDTGIYSPEYTSNIYSRLSIDGTTVIDSITVKQCESIRFTGSSKSDQVIGTPGSDTLLGGDGNDTLDGTLEPGGNDYYHGGYGNDSLRAGPASRGTLFDSSTSATLLGGAGNDIAICYAGSNLIDGGPGNDTLSENQNEDYDYGRDTLIGGLGNDVLVAAPPVWGFISPNPALLIPAFYGNTRAKATDRMYLDGGSGFDTLSADFSLQSRDITFASGASNSIDFPDGSYLRNIEKLATFTSGSGNDRLADTGRFNNYWATMAGNDSVNPGLGRDAINGGLGDDLLILDYSKSEPDLAGLTYENGHFVRRSLETGGIVDDLNAVGFERSEVTGSRQGDWIIGQAGADRLLGIAGNDTLRGGTGADTLDGGSGVDTADFSDLYGTINLTLSGSLPARVRLNGVLDDTVINCENVIASYANDTITGDQADNIINGGAGNDLLAGAGGADTFVFSDRYSVDTINDFEPLKDRILLSALRYGGVVSATPPALISHSDFASVNSQSATFIYDTSGADSGLYYDSTGGSGTDAYWIARFANSPDLRPTNLAFF